MTCYKVTDKEQIYGDSSQPEINIQPKKEEEVDGSRNDVVITKEEEEDDEEQEFHVNDEIADSSDSDETIDENNVVANVHDVKRKKSLADQGHKKYSPIHQQKIDVKEEENEEECPPILRNGILTSAALPTLENKEEIDDAEPIISSKFNSLNKRTESVVRQKPNEPIDKSALDARRTIILSKLSSKTNKKKLFQKMRKFGQIKKITMVGNNGAEVIFAEGPQVTPKFIRDVVLKLDQHELHGTTISASTKVFKRIVPVATKKQARLIIRNLSFSTSEVCYRKYIYIYIYLLCSFFVISRFDVTLRRSLILDKLATLTHNCWPFIFLYFPPLYCLLTCYSFIFIFMTHI